MADVNAPPRASTPSLVPLKRPLEDDHAPSVSSPLNPEAGLKSRAGKGQTREQREKKDSLKKRESVSAPRGSTPDHLNKKRKGSASAPSGLPSPIRYNHALPRDPFHYTIKDPLYASHEPEPFYTPDGTELRRPIDHAENKKVYRYAHCAADPTFKHSRYYRHSDSKPHGPRMSFEDTDKWFHFDDTATTVTNEKGWRMGRANVAAREGRFYYEVKILRGGPREGAPAPSSPAPSGGALPHVRMGWARREAPLDAPVGFDGYSYGLTDIRLEPMHKSRASKYLDDGAPQKKSAAGKSKPHKAKAGAAGGPAAAFASNDHAREGDVIGLEISLPSLSLHRKIVSGNYNPLVDVGSGLDHPTVGGDEDAAPNVVRDRFPVPYKGVMYFESMEYRASKGMEGYGDRGPFAKETPSPNHVDPTLRCLPHSSVTVYKNGRRVGTAFRDLMAFLPPASAPVVEKSVRAGCDDGMLGYFPAVGVFSGGVAQVNFGPDFWCPPEGLAGVVKGEGEDGVGAAGVGLRGIGDRYAEQIAEDVMYDIIDEVDFFVQDGGNADMLDV